MQIKCKKTREHINKPDELSIKDNEFDAKSGGFHNFNYTFRNKFIPII